MFWENKGDQVPDHRSVAAANGLRKLNPAIYSSETVCGARYILLALYSREAEADYAAKGLKTNFERSRWRRMKFHFFNFA